MTQRDRWLLFGTRGLRMFAFGSVSVVLVLSLRAAGLSDQQVGLLLTLTLAGDLVVSLLVTSVADRVGRRRMLLVGAVLMIASGIVFTITRDFVWLMIAATVGVLSPSDKEVGPFLALEQAGLSQLVTDERRTTWFAWYNLVGSFAAAIGALCGGILAQTMLRSGAAGSAVYQPIFVGYATIGVALLIGFWNLSYSIEPPAIASVPVVSETADTLPVKRTWFGLHQSRGVVLRLSALFMLDAFGGGFIVQSLLAYWFQRRFGLDLASLGTLFFVANLLAAGSSLVAARLAQRFGLLNTIVFTHLPSNVLLLLIPLMPNCSWAVAVLLLRFSISQMDVPTRQSYTMSVVSPDERSAAAGITTVVRSLGAAAAPMIAGYLLAREDLADVPFFIAGSVKIIYDLWLFAAFRKTRS